jgi:hypothetical protein
MLEFKSILTKALILSTLSITSCKSWDPDIQFENDVKKRNREILLLENKSQMEKKSELNVFIEYLSESVANNNEFLNWSQSKGISYEVTARSTFKKKNWETREYKFSDLIIARYGLQSEMMSFYRNVNHPTNISFITNGERCINPVIY